MSICRVAKWFGFFVLSIWLSPACADVSANGSPIFIVGSVGKVEYKHRGKKTSLAGFFDSVGQGLSREQMAEPFDVIVELAVPFSSVVGMKGVLEKKGFTNIRYFFYEKGGSWMMQVHLGKEVPLPEG